MYTRLVEFSAGILGTVLNLVLIPLILTKSAPQMARYKYLLLSYTIVACYFAFSVSTGLFTWFLPQGGFLFLSTVNLFPQWVQQFQVITFIGCYVVTIIIVDLSFIYRLSCLNDPPSGKTKLRYYAVALFGTVFLLVITVICGVFMAPQPETTALYFEVVHNALELNLQDVGYVGGQLTINGDLNMRIFSVVGVVGVFLAISCIISITCWYKIRSKLRIFQFSQNSNYNFHRKCYILLTLQTCIPILFNMFPAGVIIFLMILKAPIGDVSHYCAMVLCFAQILDPLFTIIFITEYKKFVVSLFRTKTAGEHEQDQSKHVRHGFY